MCVVHASFGINGMDMGGWWLHLKADGIFASTVGSRLCLLLLRYSQKMQTKKKQKSVLRIANWPHRMHKRTCVYNMSVASDCFCSFMLLLLLLASALPYPTNCNWRHTSNTIQINLDDTVPHRYAPKQQRIPFISSCACFFVRVCLLVRSFVVVCGGERHGMWFTWGLL